VEIVFLEETKERKNARTYKAMFPRIIQVFRQMRAG